MKFVISHYILYNFYIAIILRYRPGPKRLNYCFSVLASATNRWICCYYIAALGDLVPAFLLFLFYCFPLDAICIYFLKAVCQIYITSFEVDGSAIVHYYHICSINYVEPF